MGNVDKKYSLKEVEYFVKQAWVDGNNNTDKNGTPSKEIYAISDDSYWAQIKEGIEGDVRIEESAVIDNYLVFYMEPETISDGEIKIHLKQKLLPAFLKDKFLSEMDDKIQSKTITGDDIDEFLCRNWGKNNMKTQIIVDAKMSNEQCDALVSEIERTAEVIGINVRTETSYKSVDDNIGLLKKEISELKYAANNNHAMTDKEKEWVDLHLGTVAERVEQIFDTNNKNKI
jgi:hypothetical protein